MLNKVELEGRIVQPNDTSKPAVRAIHGKNDEVIGYSCRLRYETGSSIGFTSITHWEHDSPLGEASGGDTVRLVGRLTSRSWKTPDGSTAYAEGVTADTLHIDNPTFQPEAA